MTRTINLSQNIVMKSVKLDQYLFAMTRTVNLQNVHMWTVKTAMPKSSYKMSSSKTSQVKSEVAQSTHLSRNARKQIGTQPEVNRNCQDSTSKHCYPSGSTNMCSDSRNLKIQFKYMRPAQAEFQEKSQANTRL